MSPSLRVFLAASLVGFAAAECPNACSGHGTCGVFDMCTCYRNWQAADCSQRTCPFDLAHVDTPKGDLDMDGSISATAVISGSTVYPTGTPEMFPLNHGAAYTSAHYYMECSNKGLCDRTTGECDCFDGYEGTACQRASCANDCSGHGTCETISELAFDDFENVYALWDKDATMGCKCDSGYGSSDCSTRNCKVGVDPLYVDDTDARFTKITIRSAATAVPWTGTVQLTFYDFWGEDYVTAPIVWNQDATAMSGFCANILAALKALPNNAVSVAPTCAYAYTDAAVFNTVTLTFVGQPGYLKQLKIDTTGTTATGFVANLYSEQIGENTDYWAQRCAGVTVIPKGDSLASIVSAGSSGHLLVPNAAQIKLLKTCLGDSDGNTENNVEVFNWDYGSMKEFTSNSAISKTSPTINVVGSHPHAVRLVPVAAGGVSELHLVWFNPAPVAAGEEFRIVGASSTQGAVGSTPTTSYHVHTTNGIVEQLGFNFNDRNPYLRTNVLNTAVDGDDRITGNHSEIRITGFFDQYTNKVYTNMDASCEVSTLRNVAALTNCIQKGDKLFIIDGCWGKGAVVTEYYGGQTCGANQDATIRNTGNLYTVNKIYSKPIDSLTDSIWPLAITPTVFAGVKENRYVIEVDQNIKWAGTALLNGLELTKGSSGSVVLFKFTPAADGQGSYTYVSECSNRGACDRESGLCACFKGYTSDNCSVQSSLAV